MNKSEMKIVERHIRSIYGTWHACSMPESEVRKNGSKTKLVMCDDCNAYIKAHMQDIEAECKQAQKS